MQINHSTAEHMAEFKKQKKTHLIPPVFTFTISYFFQSILIFDSFV